MGKIIVLGSINMDVVVTADRHPLPGETIFGDELHFYPGGKGNNQAIAAKRLGGDVQLIGRLGDDAFGQSMRDFLTGEEMDLRYIKTIEHAPTGTALITVNSDSENTIVVISGVNRHFTPEDIAHIDISPDDVIVSQFEVPQPAILTLYEQAQSVGARTILNPAPAGEFVDGLLPLVNYLVVNETELAFLAGIKLTDDIDLLTQAARSLVGENQTVILTLGKNGAVAILGQNTVTVSGHDVKAVDTTGAGDCFVGALAVELSKGAGLEDALRFANLAASISVQRMGAAIALPYRAEVITRSADDT